MEPSLGQCGILLQVGRGMCWVGDAHWVSAAAAAVPVGWWLGQLQAELQAVIQPSAFSGPAHPSIVWERGLCPWGARLTFPASSQHSQALHRDRGALTLTAGQDWPPPGCRKGRAAQTHTPTSSSLTRPQPIQNVLARKILMKLGQLCPCLSQLFWALCD